MYNPFLITDGPFCQLAEWKLSSSWKICSPIGLTKRLTWQITKNLGCGRGPSCQPLHVQYSSNGMSLTTLTTPLWEHQGGVRRRGLGRERHGGREDSVVVSHAEGSTTVRGLLVHLPSPKNNSRCAWVEGWLGHRWEYGGAVKPARQHSRPRGGGSRQSRRGLFERLEQEEQRLKKHDGRWMDIQQSVLVRQPFLGKPQIYGKQHTTHLLILKVFLEPILFLLALQPILWPRLKNYTKFCIFRCGLNCF